MTSNPIVLQSSFLQHYYCCTCLKELIHFFVALCHLFSIGFCKINFLNTHSNTQSNSICYKSKSIKGLLISYTSCAFVYWYVDVSLDQESKLKFDLAQCGYTISTYLRLFSWPTIGIPRKGLIECFASFGQILSLNFLGLFGLAYASPLFDWWAKDMLVSYDSQYFMIVLNVDHAGSEVVNPVLTFVWSCWINQMTRYLHYCWLREFLLGILNVHPFYISKYRSDFVLYPMFCCVSNCILGDACDSWGFLVLRCARIKAEQWIITLL